MALLGPPGPEIPFPDQFPFSGFTQKKNLNLRFRFLIFPLDFVSRCVIHGHVAGSCQNKGLSEFGGTVFPSSKNKLGSELFRAASVRHLKPIQFSLGHLLPRLN